MTITAIRPEAVAGGHSPAAPAPAIDFDDLVREYRRRLVWSAYGRTDNWHDAEDAVQEALLDAWQRRDSYEPRPDTPAIAWVSHLAKHRAYRTLSNRWRDVPAGDWAGRFAEDLPDRDTDTGLPCMADPDTCAKVYAALAPLPDKQRLALQMECLQGMPRCEVARCLSLSLYDVGELMRNALRRFRRRTDADRTALVDAVEDAVAEANGRVDQWVAAEFRARPEFVASLPPRQRQAVEARYLSGGLSLAQSAERVGVSVASLGWALRAAKGRLQDEMAGRPARRVGGGGEGPPVSPHVLRVLDTPELLAKLSPRQREAIILRYRDGLSVVQVAEQMGATRQAVVKLVSKVMLRERARVESAVVS